MGQHWLVIIHWLRWHEMAILAGLRPFHTPSRSPLMGYQPPRSTVQLLALFQVIHDVRWLGAPNVLRFDGARYHLQRRSFLG